MLHTYAPPVHPVLKKFLLGHLTGSLSDGMVIVPMLQISTTGVTGATLNFSPGLVIARPFCTGRIVPVYPKATG